jgi:hypothetical protein
MPLVRPPRLPTLADMKLDQKLLKASWQSWVSTEGRPRVGPYWLQWVWTLLFAAILAVFFTAIGFLAFGRGEGAWRNLPGWAFWYGKNLVVCVTIAAAIQLLFDLGSATVAKPGRVCRWPAWQRKLYFMAVPLLGLAVAWPVGLWLAGYNVVSWLDHSDGRNAIVGTVLVSVLITFVLHQWFSDQAAHAQAERRATEAQLRLLQAQIEPHFLFNTLANVQSLMDHDLPKARRMLDSFTDYLRASLGSLRNERSTLGHELQLARNYLDLLQDRMEDRLRFDIVADPALLQQPLPPLLLQPLVENAVVHGLEPSIDGGRVQVTARVAGAQLVLEVLDDGRGLGAPARTQVRGQPAGQGMALENIRQRLLAQYGSSARLDIEAAQPGTRARITLPLQNSEP